MTNFGKLLDHGPAWGSFTVYPARFGVTRYRLVVFPPGISAGRRRMLRLWRAWPLWGTALWLILQITGGVVGMSETALIGGSMLVIATGALTFALTDEARAQVRSMWAVSMAGYRHDDVDRGYSLLRALAQTLDRADMDLEEGRIAPAEHEARWWLVYDTVADAPSPDAPRKGRVASAA